jgi:hypothetical protein
LLSIYQKKCFFDSAQPEQTINAASSLQRSPANSNCSLKFRGKSTLAASVNAVIEEHRKSRESSQEQTDPYAAQLTKEKLEMQISRNLEDKVYHLIEIKQKLDVETNRGIVKVLKKYEKRLKKLFICPQAVRMKRTNRFIIVMLYILLN